MKKCIISVGLVLAMVLTMTTTVFAADSKDWQSEIDVLGVASVNNKNYQVLQEAVNAAVESGSVLKLQKDNQEIFLSDTHTLNLDLNGKTATVNSGTLILTDSGTDEGVVGGKVYGDFTVTDRITEKGAIRYVVLDGKDENGKTYRTANAVRVRVSQVSIRPANTSAGMYYKTEVKFNKNVVGAAVVKEYGVALSLKNKPVADFKTENENRWTEITPVTVEGADFNKTGTSCLLAGIMDKTLGASANSELASMPVYANAYMKLNVDGEETILMAENTSPLEYSLQSVMHEFDKKFEAELTGTAALSDTAKGVFDFYSKWVNDGMSESGWKLNNLSTRLAYEQRTYNLQEDVLYLGRTYEKAGTQWFNWSASGFRVQFKGTGLEAKITSNIIKKPIENNYAYLKVYVDDQEPIDIRLNETTETVILAKDLDPDVEHTVEVRKRTSAMSSTAGLVSMEVQGGVKLDAPAAKSNKLIEFVGDSLTVGYSAATDAKMFDPPHTGAEDATKTYAKQVAEAFDAEYMVTAISGRGVVMNNAGGGGYKFPEIYPKLDIYSDAVTEYNFALKPDVIVINLGTNDATNDSLVIADFKDGVVNFIKKVREKNPNAQIIWAYGLRKDTKTADVAKAIEEAVGQINKDGDTKVHYLALELVPDELMFEKHPLEAGYEASADMLIEKIKTFPGFNETA